MKFKTSLKTANKLIDLTPLVDVVFLMLIFFLITSDILPLKSLHIENPLLDKNHTPLTTQLLVVMDAEHVIYIGSKKTIVDLTLLANTLKKEIKKIEDTAGAPPSLVLSVDRRVDYGTFLQLFATCQESASTLRLV